MPDASSNPAPRARRRRRWPWFAAASLLLLAGLGAAWFASQRVWTDGNGLHVPFFGTHVRDIIWTPPESPGPQFDIDDQVYEPAISPDGQEFYFVGGMPNAPDEAKTAKRADHSHIYVSWRKDNTWTTPTRLTALDLPTGECDDLSPRLSGDGKLLYFSSNRPGGLGGFDIWAVTRDAKAAGGAGGWDKPFNLGPSVNTQYNEYDPDPTPDGKHLIFTTNRTAAAAAQNDVWHATIRQTDAADYDLWIADTDTDPNADTNADSQRHAAAQPQDSYSPSTQPTEKPGVTDPGSDKSVAFTNPHPIDILNTPYVEGASCMSPAGDFLYFTSNRPGGFGKFDLYRSRVIDGVFGPPENLGPSINSADNDTDPAIAADGYRIYFSSDRPIASSGSGTVGRYHLLSAESREVFPAEQSRPLPHFGWSIWGVVGCGVLAALLILLLRGDARRKLNLLQKCLVISILVHVLFTFSLSFVALTQQVTHYVQHDLGQPVAFTMPKQLAETLAVRSQADSLPIPPPPPKNLPQASEVQIPSEPLPAPPDVQVTIPDAHPRPGAVHIAVAAPHPPDLKIPPAPAPAIAPAVPPVAPAPVAMLPDVPMPKPLHTDDAHVTAPPAPPVQSAQLQLPPTDTHTPPPIDLGLPNTPKFAPPPVAIAPPVPDHGPAIPPPAAPDPGTPAPPPALPAPQVAINPTAARIPPKTPITPDNVAASPDALHAQQQQQPLGDADQRNAHSAGPASIPLDASPIKKSIVANSPSIVAMAVHPAGRPDAAGSAAALPGVAATQPAQFADAPPADLASGLQTANTRTQPTTEPAIAAINSTDLAPIGPTAVVGPPAQRYAAAQPLDSSPPLTRPLHPAATPLTGDPALGWQPGNKNPMGIGHAAPPAPSPAAAANISQAPTIAAAPIAPAANPQPANPTPDASAGPLAVASARIPADRQPLTPGSGAAAFPDVGEIAPPTGLHNLPGVGQAGMQGRGIVAMAPMSRPPDVSAPAVLPQVSLQPLTGLSGPVSPFARSAPQRQQLLKQNGGTKQSEDAVDRGLAYLASTQEPDGRWTRVTDDSPPGNRPVGMHDMACTGLSLLAFLAHDQTPDKPCQYRDVVKKAADYLLSQQGSDGDMRGPAGLRGGGADHANMYDHGIASFAIGELAAMTHDPRYTQAALKAADFTVAAQDPRTGGWRYLPGEIGDSSVFGWQIMSLHTAADLLGYNIPQSTRDGAAKFIKLVSQGEYASLATYQPNRGATPPMTAEILFSRMLLGEKLTDADMTEATTFLAQQKPSSGNPDFYYWYYASLSMFQMNARFSTPAWKEWNAQTRDTLIAMQQPTGYWDTRVRWGDRGGRIFTTAIATLTLEVYYRYLPLQPTTRPE